MLGSRGKVKILQKKKKISLVSTDVAEHKDCTDMEKSKLFLSFSFPRVKGLSGVGGRES